MLLLRRDDKVKPLRDKNGFTLIELLVVISVILILVGIAVPALNKARTSARNAEVKAGINEIHQALSQYSVDNNGFFPGMHWVVMPDSTGRRYSGTLYSGSALLGGTPDFGSDLEQKLFEVPTPDNPQRYLSDGVTPDPARVDALVEAGYLLSYPANPFLRVGGRSQRQMSNLFYFRADPESGPVFTYTPNLYDWNRYATFENTTMRADYEHHGRGHFTYIPINPVHPMGIDYINDWDTLNNISDPAEQNRLKSQFYRNVRAFILIGWGATRADDSVAKGFSVKYYNRDIGGFDFDNSLDIDPVESSIQNLIRFHMDETGQIGGPNVGAYGAPDVDGIPIIDSGLYGAAIIISSGL